jgi:hypothetical protein
MAVLTTVYVIATIWIVYESRRNNRLTAKFEKDRSRPHVVFWVEAEMSTYGEHFTSIEYIGKVRNEGASTAHDVTISTTPKISARQGMDKDDQASFYTPSFLENPNSVITPKQLIVEKIGPTKFFLEDNDDSELRFSVLIKYKDINGSEYTTEYEIDLSRNKGRMFSEDEQAKAFFKLVKNIDDAANSLSEINRTLNQPDRSNLFQKDFDLTLSDDQQTLLQKNIRTEQESGTEGETWLLAETIGKTSIRQHTDKGELEIEVKTKDIQTLSQAGLLRGYYKDNLFWFYVAPLPK